MSIQALVAEVLAAPPARGRRPAKLEAGISRELGQEDIAKLQGLKFGALGSGATTIKKLRHTHHSLARLIAEGTREAECSAVTGYSGVYISIIKQDPAFQELVAHYKSVKDVVYLDVHERLKGVALDAVGEIQERLAEQPEAFKPRELLEIAQLGFDRSGYGPTKTLNSNALVALVDASRIEELKSAIRNDSRGRVRPLLAQDSPMPIVGGTVIEGSLAGAEAAQGSERSGPDLPAQSGSLPETKVS